MSKYGIKLVWNGFYTDTVIGFSPTAYERWKHEIQPCVRMLIYETSKNNGAQAIVSEVEVVHGFAETAKLDFVAPTEEHNHLVRVKVIRGKGRVSIIPRNFVQTVLKRPTYPQEKNAWLPISEAQYVEFIKFWDGR